MFMVANDKVVALEETQNFFTSLEKLARRKIFVILNQNFAYKE